MIKKGMLLILIFIAIGCAYEGKHLDDYLENPQLILKDPHFLAYQDQRAIFEHQYLHGQMTYAEFTEKMKTLDAKYLKEVKERNDKITAQQ